MEFDHYPEHKKFTLSWTQVEKYIDLMIQSDRYLTDKEKEHNTPPVPITVESDATLTHAQNLIRDFCLEEYDSEPDFSNLSKIGVAYTNATDEDIPIQVNVDLVGYRVDVYKRQAMSYAKVLGATSRQDGYREGNGYLVSWCGGHLVELAPPNIYDAKYTKWSIADLPILPQKWQYLVSASTKKQFSILQKLMHRPDVESIVNSCDSGREGELIFRLVYQQAGCKKPVSRLWLSSMEETAIREGFAHLKPSTEYDALYNAAPVSYTHLDVYKRHALHGGTGNGASAMSALNGKRKTR